MTAKRLLSLGVSGINQGSKASILTEKDFVSKNKTSLSEGAQFLYLTSETSGTISGQSK
jgi:hypothetical protein